MLTLVPLTLFTLALLIKWFHLFLAFYFWTNNLAVPVVDQVRVPSLSPLIQKLADLFLPQVIIGFLAMKTCLTFQVLYGFLDIKRLFDLFSRLINWLVCWLLIGIVVFAILKPCLSVQIRFPRVLHRVVKSLLGEYERHLLVVRPMISQQLGFFRYHGGLLSQQAFNVS
jgi:hypothetical protein